MGYYLELAKRAIGKVPRPESAPLDPDATLPASATETSPPLILMVVANQYAERMKAALKEINRPDYPAGMIFWLEKAHPRLYRELTEYLPEDIHRLWEAHVPLEEFEYTLERLVTTHQRAVALYRESTSRSL